MHAPKPNLSRRKLLAAAALSAPALLLSKAPARAGTKGTLKIGYQKSSVTLFTARAKGVFEAKLAPLGYDVDLGGIQLWPAAAWRRWPRGR